MDKIIINNSFWYLCDMAPGCLCSYRSTGNRPKYQIVPAIGDRAVLAIFSDFDEDKQTLTFDPIGKGDAITEAMHFAERYEAVYSKS